jgi:hypothetical protein
MAIALRQSLAPREKPLSEQMIAVAAGEVDVPEYSRLGWPAGLAI